jgi:hypothetical protein
MAKGDNLWSCVGFAYLLYLFAIYSNMRWATLIYPGDCIIATQRYAFLVCRRLYAARSTKPAYAGWGKRHFRQSAQADFALVGVISIARL